MKEGFHSVDLGAVNEKEGSIGKEMLPSAVQAGIAEVSTLLNETDETGSELHGTDVEAAAAEVTRAQVEGKLEKPSITLRTIRVVCDTVQPITAVLGIPLPGRVLTGARLVSSALERFLFGKFHGARLKLGRAECI